MNQKRVLVIDDEDFIRDLVKDFLQLQGVVTDEASTVQSGVQLLAKGAYDLVLLDRNLGQLKADDLIKELRQANKEVPIVILTGDQLSDQNFVKEIGANGIIYKPFQVDDFLKNVNIYLGCK